VGQFLTVRTRGEALSTECFEIFIRYGLVMLPRRIYDRNHHTINKALLSRLSKTTAVKEGRRLAIN